jgi:hypothetical protein
MPMIVTLDNKRATIAAADGPVGPFDPVNSTPLWPNRDPTDDLDLSGGSA